MEVGRLALLIECNLARPLSGEAGEPSRTGLGIGAIQSTEISEIDMLSDAFSQWIATTFGALRVIRAGEAMGPHRVETDLNGEAAIFRRRSADPIRGTGAGAFGGAYISVRCWYTETDFTFGIE